MGKLKGLAFTVDFEDPTRIDAVRKLVEATAGKVTIYVTGKILDDHGDKLDFLSQACVGLHGYYHIKISRYSTKSQANEINLATRAYQKFFCRPPQGWRSPYLDFNSTTLRLLRLLGFKWDSSYKQSPITWLRRIESPIRLIPIDARGRINSGTIMYHCYELDDDITKWVSQRPNLVRHDQL